MSRMATHFIQYIKARVKVLGPNSQKFTFWRWREIIGAGDVDVDGGVEIWGRVS